MHIGSYYITYQTEEATALAPYPCTKVQLAELMGSNPEMADRIVTSLYRQLKAILDQYKLARKDCDNFYHYLTDSYTQYASFCTKHGS